MAGDAFAPSPRPSPPRRGERGFAAAGGKFGAGFEMADARLGIADCGFGVLWESCSCDGRFFEL